jgi:hypothetical protein
MKRSESFSENKRIRPSNLASGVELRRFRASVLPGPEEKDLEALRTEIFPLESISSIEDKNLEKVILDHDKFFTGQDEGSLEYQLNQLILSGYRLFDSKPKAQAAFNKIPDLFSNIKTKVELDEDTLTELQKADPEIKKIDTVKKHLTKLYTKIKHQDKNIDIFYTELMKAFSRNGNQNINEDEKEKIRKIIREKYIEYGSSKEKEYNGRSNWKLLIASINEELSKRKTIENPNSTYIQIGKDYLRNKSPFPTDQQRYLIAAILISENKEEFDEEKQTEKQNFAKIVDKFFPGNCFDTLLCDQQLIKGPDSSIVFSEKEGTLENRRVYKRFNTTVAAQLSSWYTMHLKRFALLEKRFQDINDLPRLMEQIRELPNQFDEDKNAKEIFEEYLNSKTPQITAITHNIANEIQNCGLADKIERFKNPDKFIEGLNDESSVKSNDLDKIFALLDQLKSFIVAINKKIHDLKANSDAYSETSDDDPKDYFQGAFSFITKLEKPIKSYNQWQSPKDRYAQQKKSLDEQLTVFNSLIEKNPQPDNPDFSLMLNEDLRVFFIDRPDEMKDSINRLLLHKYFRLIQKFPKDIQEAFIDHFLTFCKEQKYAQIKKQHLLEFTRQNKRRMFINRKHGRNIERLIEIKPFTENHIQYTSGFFNENTLFNYLQELNSREKLIEVIQNCKSEIAAGDDKEQKQKYHQDQYKNLIEILIVEYMLFFAKLSLGLIQEPSIKDIDLRIITMDPAYSDIREKLKLNTIDKAVFSTTIGRLTADISRGFSALLKTEQIYQYSIKFNDLAPEPVIKEKSKSFNINNYQKKKADARKILRHIKKHSKINFSKIVQPLQRNERDEKIRMQWKVDTSSKIPSVLKKLDLEPIQNNEDPKHVYYNLTDLGKILSENYNTKGKLKLLEGKNITIDEVQNLKMQIPHDWNMTINILQKTEHGSAYSLKTESLSYRLIGPSKYKNILDRQFFIHQTKKPDGTLVSELSDGTLVYQLVYHGKDSEEIQISGVPINVPTRISLSKIQPYLAQPLKNISYLYRKKADSLPEFEPQHYLAWDANERNQAISYIKINIVKTIKKENPKPTIEGILEELRKNTESILIPLSQFHAFKKQGKNYRQYTQGSVEKKIRGKSTPFHVKKNLSSSLITLAAGLMKKYNALLILETSIENFEVGSGVLKSVFGSFKKALVFFDQKTLKALRGHTWYRTKYPTSIQHQTSPNKDEDILFHPAQVISAAYTSQKCSECSFDMSVPIKKFKKEHKSIKIPSDVLSKLEKGPKQITKSEYVIDKEYRIEKKDFEDIKPSKVKPKKECVDGYCYIPKNEYSKLYKQYIRRRNLKKGSKDSSQSVYCCPNKDCNNFNKNSDINASRNILFRFILRTFFNMDY